MTETYDNPQSSRRQLQIQKLLEAINNYSPSPDESIAMKNAKNDMIKNIQKKFALSKVNLTYRFPFNSSPQFDSDNSETQEIPQFCMLKAQNIKGKQLSKSKQKNRRPLQENSSNKSEANLYSKKKSHQNSKTKSKNPSLFKHIQTTLKNGLKCQTPKVIKKQIILTHKKQHLKENTKNQINFNDQRQNIDNQTFSNIKTKLKIKKPNNQFNETKKITHLRTQNNVTFKHYTQNGHSNGRLDHFNEEQNECQLESFNQGTKQQKYVIYEEPSEESMFFNSRNNQSIDQNTKFEYPKALFNVSDLKEKLRQSSKSNKKESVKRHKRTVTQGSAQIKIKLFSNSFQKKSCEKSQGPKQLTFSSFLFKKNDHIVSVSNIMNRTVSSLSQHSLKKGIKLCSKVQPNGERSLSKGSMKFDKATIKSQTKYTISKLGKAGTEEITFGKEKKNLMLSSSFTMNEDEIKGQEDVINNKKLKGMKIECRGNKENIQVNKVSKINSIMTSLKEGYKVKNGNAKSQVGIKTTVCR